MRTIFLGSPPFATRVLRRTCASAHRPLALVTAPDRPKGRGREVEPSELVLAARDEGVRVLQPEDPHAPECLDELRALEPEVLVVASYGVIMKPALLDLAPHGALNVHGSLLPRHRGASPIQAAIAEGDEVTGVTIQRMVRALDEGDVIVTRERPIGPKDTAGDLYEALAELGGEALVEALDSIERGAATFTPQDPERATYARKLKKAQGAIDWTRPAVELERHVRAMTPWPGATFVDPKGRKVTVLEASVVDGTGAPGTVLENGERFVVATGEGALALDRLQRAGKRPMGGAEFLRGARLATGDLLAGPEA